MGKFEKFPATIFRGIEPYPTISGFPEDPMFVDKPDSRLNPNKKESMNNHHGLYYRRAFTTLTMFKLCHDLELNQFPMFIDQHDWLHSNFDQTPPPTLLQCMDRLMAANDCDERIRTGSLHHPKFRLLNDDDMFKVNHEYDQEAHIRIVSYAKI